MPDFMLESTDCVKPANLDDLSTLQLAQALIERLTISPNDWHKLKSNRQARSSEQAAAALARVARIAWAMMATGEAYRGKKAVAMQAAGVAVTA